MGVTLLVETMVLLPEGHGSFEVGDKPVARVCGSYQELDKWLQSGMRALEEHRDWRSLWKPICDAACGCRLNACAGNVSNILYVGFGSGSRLLART
jgi:hypothetical protein